MQKIHIYLHILYLSIVSLNYWRALIGDELINYYYFFRYIKVQTKSLIIDLSTIRRFKDLKNDNNKIYVVVTIDTEQDVDNRYVNSGTYFNIEHGVPKLLEIFDSYDCKASWMVTPDVIERYPHFFKKLLSEKHEIGCHVHPEYFMDQSISYIEHKIYLCNLPKNTQRKMISDATDIIEKSIGKRPISFRAGKYGVDETTLSVLESEGYLVDTSISPNINWRKNGGPDWSPFPSVQPYFINKLLEVPLTIINFMGMNFWVRPSISTYSAMKKIVDLIKLQHNDPVVINIMFHSMESIDPNPYIKSELFMSNLNNFLNYLKLKNAKFVTLHQLYEILNF